MRALLSRSDAAMLRSLGRYAKPHLGAFAAVLACVVVLSALQLAQPWLIKRAIDTLMVPAGGLGPLERAALAPRAGLYALAYAGLTALAAGLDYAQGVVLKTLGARILARIRTDAFAHLLGQEIAYFDANPVGRLVTRVTNDIEALAELYTTIGVNVLKDLLMLLGAVGVLWAMSPRLTLVCLAAMPCVVGTAALFQRASRRVWTAVRARLADLNATSAEHLAGMRTTQLFAAAERERGTFARANDAYYEATMEQMRVFALFRPWLDVFTTLALAGVIYMGGHGVLAGAVGFGTLYAFTAYMRRLFEPVNDLAEKANVLQSALAAAERLFELLGRAPALLPPARGATEPVPGAPAVAFENVSFAYVGERWVLKDVSFAVPAGATAAFVGHTGAGKSTLMSLVARFYDVQAGRVLVDGVDVRAWDLAALRARVALVWQDVFLFAATADENVRLAPPGPGAEATGAALEALGAGGLLARLGGASGAALGERGLTLSAGERQWIGAARAMAKGAPIVVLDEATASLDTDAERRMQAAVAAMAPGRTMLVVAHRLSTVRGADRLFVLHHGRLVESGSHAELLASGGLYADLWRLQFAEASLLSGTLEGSEPRSQ